MAENGKPRVNVPSDAPKGTGKRGVETRKADPSPASKQQSRRRGASGGDAFPRDSSGSNNGSNNGGHHSHVVHIHSNSSGGSSPPLPNTALVRTASPASAEFELLDEQVQRSTMYARMLHVVRVLSAQQTENRMIVKLEEALRELLGCSLVRIFIARPNKRMVHRNGTCDPNVGIVGLVHRTQQGVNLSVSPNSPAFVSLAAVGLASGSGGGSSMSGTRSPSPGPNGAAMAPCMHPSFNPDVDSLNDVISAASVEPSLGLGLGLGGTGMGGPGAGGYSPLSSSGSGLSSLSPNASPPVSPMSSSISSLMMLSPASGSGGGSNPDDDKPMSDPAEIAALLCVPVFADASPDHTPVVQAGPGAGERMLVAIAQCFRTKDNGTEYFSKRDMLVVQRIGEWVGNLLKNSESLDMARSLYSHSIEEHKRSDALLDVAKALASETARDKLVSIIVSQVPELLDADRCTLYFVDKEKHELIVTRGASKGRRKTLVSWVFGQSNAPELPFEEGRNEFRFSMNEGIAGYVAQTGQTLNIEDAHFDRRFNPKIDRETGYRTRSMLCVPMIDAQGIIIGVVQAINKNPLHPRFSEEDETLLKTFSAQAALAVRNSFLHEKTNAALRQSDALLEVTQALSRELHVGPLIQIIVTKVQQLLEADRCTVYIVEEDKKELYTTDSMSYGMGPSLPIDKEKASVIRFPINRGIAGSVATTGIMTNIPDAYLDYRFNKDMDLKTGFRTKAILCMAIKSKGSEVIGVLQVMNKKQPKVKFDAEDERLLDAFSAQAAVAIENSRLFLQTERALNHALADQRNLKFMLSVTKNLFSSLHMSSVIDQMTMQVHHLLKADDCALYLVDNKEKVFYLAKETEDGKIYTKKWPFTKGIVGHVARTGEIVRISTEAHRDIRFDAEVDQRREHTTHSILCCPIRTEPNKDDKDAQPAIIGVISVRDEKDRGGFEQEEEKLLKVFCAQAGVAIMNSKKFEAITSEAESKDRDTSSTDWLVDKGFKIQSDNIEKHTYRMDQLEMKGQIGTGSYGEVYRAVVDGKLVAVKKLHVRNLKAEQIDAFCKEASLMCQLKHPNVVGFVGAVTDPQNLCIITQFCARGSLADLLLDERIPMPSSLKLKFAIDAAKGMLYLHGSNPVILHRDLKSDNLLVASDWTIKVADFGLTRFLSNGKKAMTQVGTPMWMAPEIIMGRKYTEKADVYAFGIILWEIMTRMEPYDDKEPMQIVVEVVNENLRPRMLPEFDGDSLIPLMKDCWATNPDDRPSFKEVVERLEILLDKECKKEKQERTSRRGNSLSGASGSNAPGAIAAATAAAAAASTAAASGAPAPVAEEEDADEPLTPRSIAARAAGGDPSAGPEKRSHRLSARLAAVSSTQTQFSPRSSTRSNRSSRGSYEGHDGSGGGSGSGSSTPTPMSIVSGSHSPTPSSPATHGAKSAGGAPSKPGGGGGASGGGGGGHNHMPSTVQEEEEDDV